MSLKSELGFESWGAVLRREDHWAAVGGLQPKGGARSARVIATGDRAVCLAGADDWVNQHESAETAHRSRAWTKQPPSEKQRRYLPQFARENGVTRYEASCYLAVRFNTGLIKPALGQAGAIQ